MSTLSPARRSALELVSHLRRSGAYARDYLRDSVELAALSALDRALATRLVLGTIAAQGELDICIDVHLNSKRNFEPRARDALRISCFELLYMNTAPEVVVDQAVELVRCVTPRLAGMTNAVMRRIAEEERKTLFKSREFVLEGVGEESDFARVAAWPEWLSWEISQSIGREQASLLALDALETPPLFVSANTYRFDEASAFETLEAAGAEPRPTPFPHCFVAENAAAFAKSGLVERGDFIPADLAAVAVVELLPLKRSARILEIGQGRATKTLLMDFNRLCALGNYSLSCIEKDERKASIAKERTARADTELNYSQFVLDGRELLTQSEEPTLQNGFDLVFLDAPCSGTGTMRRHPEIVWSLEADALDPSNKNSLPALQFELLSSAAACVKPGASLVYSTCSALKSENEDLIESFLASEAGSRFEVVNPLEDEQRLHDESLLSYFSERISSQGFFHSWPGTLRSDLHFAACLRAKRSN